MSFDLVMRYNELQILYSEDVHPTGYNQNILDCEKCSTHFIYFE
jgi:hypothetical protein